MSRERDILERLKIQIKTINGAGSYTYDVSGDDQVTIGAKAVPHRVPAVYIYALGTETTQVSGSTLLRNYDRRMLVALEGWCGTDRDDSAEAHLDTLDFQDDIMRALEGDRTLNNLAHDLEVSAASYDGEEWDAPGLGVVVARVAVTYSEVAGA
jgi:hypothetical protein